MKWTEAEIQALKAQEAKDLAVEFFELLEPKDKGPISPGEVQKIRAEARDEFRREFNITRADPIDVTDLFYREQAARTEAERRRNQLDKLDAEIRRTHQHIEREPERIAAAAEAAKTPVQNYIEQGGKR